MNKKYDIIVIGGGHNGLTTATLLAKKGKKVLVLEKRHILGGVAAGEEFHPGYKTNGLLHDTSQIRTHILTSLQLEKYGLKLIESQPSVALLSKEGDGIHLSPDKNKSAQAIAQFSKKDAMAYIEYKNFIDKIAGFINGLMNEVPPDLMNLGTRQMWALGKKGFALKRLGNKTMLELLKVAPMSVADFLDEKFETEFLKAGLAHPAIFGSYTGPWSSYTTLNLLLWECSAKNKIIGGPQALIKALEKAAKANGVEIKTQSVVEKIILKNGKVHGVKLENEEEYTAPIVAASCHPKETFLKLINPNEIEYPLEHSMLHYRSRGTTAKVNLALSKPIEFKMKSEIPIEFARTGNSIMEMERAFDLVKYRTFSSEPILDIHVPTIDNPLLAPNGHSVVSILAHFAPYHFDEGWTEEQKELFGKSVVKTLEQYTNGLSESLVANEILSPLDLEKRYSLTEGHVFHGEHAVDQLTTRPIPSCARYATPISGLYLCGSGSHPGGGITCAPGALAAQIILGKR